ncbi:MAG: hypothetical protein SPJ29_04395 [Phocaeicola sp.]|nr:hypothetical protein [Prevotellaceae bacterium]MDY5938977.1 hypothetical protein [Phocaeicola sp.]
MEEIILNEHNKQEYPPMHTCEHIINGTMVRLFGCKRAISSHIERKKSKLDFALEVAPTDEEIRQLEQKVNEVISSCLPITTAFLSLEEVKTRFDVNRLPENVSEVVRVVRVGDYDECLCVGTHVSNTSEIGTFKITTHSFENGVWRMRFKLV